MNIEAIIRAVQGELSKTHDVDIDGKDGPQTWSAIYNRVTGKVWNDAASTTMAPVKTEALMVPAQDRVDDRSEKNIATLIPQAQPYARALIHSAKAQGITLVITSGSRTYEEQNALFAQGRSKPGKIVTNARGGQSNHNFGLAFDVTIFKGKTPVWESPQYKAVGALGKRLGLKWGGDWRGGLVDEPHFEYNPKGYTVAQLRIRKEQGLPLV
jgi:peptidoglycan LD-endopeptidase CwlK